MAHNAKPGPAYICEIRLLVQWEGDPPMDEGSVADFMSETLRSIKQFADWAYVAAPSCAKVLPNYSEGDLCMMLAKKRRYMMGEES